jgi:hypothetical protein
VEEVILLANYILNKIPHKYLDKTPYKLWKDQTSSYKHKSIRVSNQSYGSCKKKYLCY